MIDHRASPGISSEVSIAAGLPADAGRGVFESATVTCRHCQRIVILNPDRSRPREYCLGCNHYICDSCAAIAVKAGCVPFAKVLDLAEAAIVKAEASTFIPMIAPTSA